MCSLTSVSVGSSIHTCLCTSQGFPHQRSYRRGQRSSRSWSACSARTTAVIAITHGTHSYHINPKPTSGLCLRRDCTWQTLAFLNATPAPRTMHPALTTHLIIIITLYSALHITALCTHTRSYYSFSHSCVSRLVLLANPPPPSPLFSFLFLSSLPSLPLSLFFYLFYSDPA